MDMKEKRISGETIFEGHVVKLIKDKVLCPNGMESYREIVKHNGGAAILCINKNEEVLLIRQFRYAYDEVMYEIPAGKLEKGENPYDVDSVLNQFLYRISESLGFTNNGTTNFGWKSSMKKAEIP